MELQLIEKEFSVCKISDLTGVDLKQEFLFLAITNDEISLVCSTKQLPINILEVEHGWNALKFVGELDFSLVGILAKISNILANNGISIFAISTYNTDYILIKSDRVGNAIKILKENEYTFV